MRHHRITTSPAIPKLQPGLHPTGPHLTESQIDDCIIGDLAPAPAAHLAACPLCADRVNAAASPFTSFQAVGATWSERLSATLPAPVPAPQKSGWQRHLVLAAPCFVLIFGLTVIRATYVNNTDASATQSSADSSRQSRVSEDNQMLEAIEADVNANADSPADLGLRPVSASPPSSSTPSSVRD